ncbi:MAG: DNA-binding response regulator [Bacteroidetes bacterium]|nr:MAG: DNA-binding response regulator [Bacteroidota bacterium]
MNSIRVAIADDHPVVLSGIVAMLGQQPGIEVSGHFTSGKALTDWLAGHTPPEVLLLDLNLGQEDGLTLCGQLVPAYPGMAVVILTSFDQPAMVRSALQAGAKGYLLKNARIDELTEGIRTVAAGEEYLHAPIRERLLAEALHRPPAHFLPKISRREQDVLRLIVAEHTTQEIADRLHISVNTVETHRTNLIQKLGVRNVAGLVKITLERGLLDP